MELEIGQSVVARVQLDNELQWMLSEVLRYFPDSDEYEIMDLLPDASSKPITVKSADVRRYASEVSNITSGQRFLCIWNDGNQWLSVLYPCQALELYPGESSDSMVVKVKFDGVPEVEYVHSSWLVVVD